ncbi:unknown protein [Simkania negevensis Z]|uniref:Uncharacterized protein n=1 Tax=Simkania negevensis (strain ATCC VR-1471 / DSM 27360 / Z) TaxID=331113 RepID=F8L486_SIMNZ|nr:unknown protein [Simkania negevensis Z]
MKKINDLSLSHSFVRAKESSFPSHETQTTYDAPKPCCIGSHIIFKI